MRTFTVGDSARLDGSINADAGGAQIVLNLRKPDGTTVTKTPGWVSDSAGTWSYDVLAEDFDQPGVWWVEAQVTFANSEIQTFGPNRFRVVPQIA